MKTGVKIAIAIGVVGVATGAGIYIYKKNKRPQILVNDIDKEAKTISIKLDGKTVSIPFGSGLQVKNGWGIEPSKVGGSGEVIGVDLKKNGAIYNTIFKV
jgi:L-cysteine desulfidase